VECNKNFNELNLNPMMMKELSTSELAVPLSAYLLNSEVINRYFTSPEL
jgi:hypothetical protein